MLSRLSFTAQRRTTRFLLGSPVGRSTRLLLYPPCPRALGNHTPAISRFSTESSSSGVTGWFQDKVTERAKRSEQKTFDEQILRMAQVENWTLASFRRDLETTTGSWKSKIPFLTRNSKEVQSAKQSIALINAILDVTQQDDLQPHELSNLSRVHKLKAALQADCTVEEANRLILQFEQMEVMHAILRKRHLQGKPLPKDEAAVQTMVMVEAPNVMSKKQKNKMMKTKTAKMIQRMPNKK